MLLCTLIEHLCQACVELGLSMNLFEEFKIFNQMFVIFSLSLEEFLMRIFGQASFLGKSLVNINFCESIRFFI